MWIRESLKVRDSLAARLDMGQWFLFSADNVFCFIIKDEVLAKIAVAEEPIEPNPLPPLHEAQLLHRFNL